MNLRKPNDINKYVADDELTHEGFENALIKKSYIMHEMKRVQSKDHTIGLYGINKICLLSYDDKHISSIFSLTI